MIVTHSQNLQGQTRVYLGAKGSVDVYIVPDGEQGRWQAGYDPSVTCAGLPVERYCVANAPIAPSKTVN